MMYFTNFRGHFLLGFFLCLFCHIQLGKGSHSRLHRYESLYKTHKCHFPSSNPPLFGTNGSLAACADVADPTTKHKKKFVLSESLCQSLLDELLIYCHADQIAPFKERNILKPELVVKFMTSSNVHEVCSDPVVKKFHADSDWKMLGDEAMCQTICLKYLPLCRMQIYLWKLADIEESADKSTSSGNKSSTASVHVNGTTPSPHVPVKTTTLPTTTTSTTRTPPTRPPTSVSFSQVMVRVMKEKTGHDGFGGGTHPDHGSGGQAHMQTPVQKSNSLSLGGKLFIFFGIFSIVLIVGAYVAYYKRSQIRAFCCEDPGDVRYRRIREDRKQQAAQPLKNLAF